MALHVNSETFEKESYFFEIIITLTINITIVIILYTKKK